MRNLDKLGLALLFAGHLLGGCGDPAPGLSAAAATDDPVQTCEALFEREAACTDAFIPMLVDLRIRHDLPAGIGAAGRALGGRAQLIAQAKQEWRDDSQPAARARTCARIAPGQPAESVAAVRTCLARSSCEELVACVSPLHEAMLTAGR